MTTTTSFTRLRTLLLLCLLGFVTGALLQPSIVSAEFCENDECEGGSTCISNSGGNTSCDMTSGSGSCKTRGC